MRCLWPITYANFNPGLLKRQVANFYPGNAPNFHITWKSVYNILVYTVGHLTFWISLSLSPKFGLRPKISQKVKSFFYVWSQRLAECLAETKLRTERSLNPKPINSPQSPVDFACRR